VAARGAKLVFLGAIPPLIALECNHSEGGRLRFGKRKRTRVRIPSAAYRRNLGSGGFRLPEKDRSTKLPSGSRDAIVPRKIS